MSSLGAEAHSQHGQTPLREGLWMGAEFMIAPQLPMHLPPARGSPAAHGG